MKSTQVFAAACSATQLGVRLNDEQLKLLAGKAARTLRFATPEDIANLAAVLAPYNRWALRGQEAAWALRQCTAYMDCAKRSVLAPCPCIRGSTAGGRCGMGMQRVQVAGLRLGCLRYTAELGCGAGSTTDGGGVVQAWMEFTGVPSLVVRGAGGTGLARNVVSYPGTTQEKARNHTCPMGPTGTRLRCAKHSCTCPRLLCWAALGNENALPVMVSCAAKLRACAGACAHRLPAEVDSEWLGRLAATALPMLESMSGEQLVDLLLLFVKQVGGRAVGRMGVGAEVRAHRGRVGGRGTGCCLGAAQQLSFVPDALGRRPLPSIRHTPLLHGY